MAFRKIKAGLVKSDVDEFLGEEGNLFFDTTDGLLRLSDGSTPGGILVSSGGGGSTNSFARIAVAGQNNVVADNFNDLLTLVAGSGISILTNATTDTITISNTLTDTNTTYDFSADTSNGSTVLKLSGSDSSLDSITLSAVKNIDVSLQNGSITFSVPDRVTTLYVDGELSVENGTIRWYSPFSINISKITARLSESADSTVGIRINKNGSSISTINISANQTKTVLNVDISMVVDDYLTVDVTSIGTSSKGSGLSVEFTYSIT